MLGVDNITCVEMGDHYVFLIDTHIMFQTDKETHRVQFYFWPLLPFYNVAMLAAIIDQKHVPSDTEHRVKMTHP